MATLLLVEKSVLETDSPTSMVERSVHYLQSLSSMTESGSICIIPSTQSPVVVCRDNDVWF